MCLSLYILIRWCIHVACIVLVLIVPVLTSRTALSLWSLNCDGPRRTQTGSLFSQISGKTSDFSSITKTVGLLAHFVLEAFLNESASMLSRNLSIEDMMKQSSPLKFAEIKADRHYSHSRHFSRVKKHSSLYQWLTLLLHILYAAPRTTFSWGGCKLFWVTYNTAGNL